LFPVELDPVGEEGLLEPLTLLQSGFSPQACWPQDDPVSESQNLLQFYFFQFSSSNFNPDLFDLVAEPDVVLFEDGFIDEQRRGWFQAVLDAVPLPVHVMDKHMNWVFMNLAFEKLMKEASIITERHESVGKPCSLSGKSSCKTPNCGVVQLTKGVVESFFDWGGGAGRRSRKGLCRGCQ
jgi:hypothetical protein